MKIEPSQESLQQSSSVRDTHANQQRGTTTILAKNENKPVRVLLDTGSQLSFIDSKLVAELELSVVKESKLRVKTFGSNRIKEESHKIVEVNLLDKDEGIHRFHLFDSPTITSHTILPPLTMQDLRFTRSKGIELSSQLNDHRKPPQILLGCDQMWDMIENSIEKLPSGLHLIGTKFGHMISGRQQHLTEEIHDAVLLKEIEGKDQELEMFDKYWSLESSGTNEYAGPDKKKSSERRSCEKFQRNRRTPPGWLLRSTAVEKRWKGLTHQ
ncbi:hypothetical protein OESDEN_22674 [Oesophagostomum dentatum]|uniref:DUF1758 domain-containing protein n=1 Tax=Oesophagostomum dentatum TaxID=61180 RepID=A0A0B1S1F4_OESDE|nr:hypothetical protein OESDEN_22674 [Oesophagostomum dentatum]